MFQKILLELIRTDCGNSQKTLSDKTGIPTSTVNSWCKGKSEPNSAQLVVLADFFDVSTDYLLGREPTEHSSLEKRKELRPSTLKLVDATEKLNDMGIAVVLGYVARLIEDNPEFLLPWARLR